MFRAVTRGLIRVERRKTLGRRRFWQLALLLVFLSALGAAYTVWQYQPDWMIQKWSADWPRDTAFRSR